jgi:hypothetical protein
MNKYIFPGADASCSLGWVISHLEATGFEVKNIDVLGVHYSATIYRWYKNWVSNKDKVTAKYGDRFVPFNDMVPMPIPFMGYIVGTEYGSSSLLTLPSYLGVFPSLRLRTLTVIPFLSQGSASVFQITMHKNLNAFHRIEGVTNHSSIHITPKTELVCVLFSSLFLTFTEVQL